jgi:hypothetical protein
LVELIEPNRRRSRATLRIWRLKFGQKWPEDEMQNYHVIYLQLLTVHTYDMPHKFPHLRPCRDQLGWQVNTLWQRADIQVEFVFL